MTMLVRKGNGMRARELDRFFDGFFTPVLRRSGSEHWAPAVDVKEDENNFYVIAELPGISKEDMHVEVENNRLSIRGERKFEKQEEKENFHFVERSYGSFFRSFTLPRNVNPDAIEAEYKDGVLSLTLPKREEVKPRSVEVKA